MPVAKRAVPERVLPEKQRVPPQKQQPKNIDNFAQSKTVVLEKPSEERHNIEEEEQQADLSALVQKWISNTPPQTRNHSNTSINFIVEELV